MTWFFVLYYLVAGALSALTGGVVALVGGLILAAIQTGLALGTRRRPRPMMLATAGLFGVLILPPLVTNPLSVISFGPILGIVLIVYGVREAEDLRKLMAASRGGR